ncbi:low-specificity L-threonine aldolase [Shewanella sp. 1_MG-2023]|jgi:threonine aldolase|uniref:low-specificity L-threonine aldolase n=1 Tax=unclassified Shewanella TaxID=196818 RepID=UPI001E4475FE|nr:MULTISPECIES: low-specificity L-threonine aldolase [unclassified Shewanella]MCC4832618.1 low-specificity L-threonine aldolase [Shewanella sp. 10N.7]MDO6612518.1 low-specificity L-threonine aldolase [Shewanella sp. 7_MG-2023]MDO6772441.1 low-specificity L-threonine aldolase [Shewanella sp. 2_MG-2023]MDO6794561.1 low-specificity L-threonine aldolase [Shewanella sp. 1_MG-2023]
MIDFRSDTVTKPTDAMRKAMAQAEVGDDVYGDDPTVNRLQDMAAERFGFDSALFVSSGTQANLLALMSHCERGDEYLCGQQAHNYKFEGGGAAVLGSIQPQPLNNQADGSILLADIEAAIKPDDVHFAHTRLLSIENTIGGKVLPQQYLADAQALAFNRGLKIHLDGARVANAAVAQNVQISEITQYFDSVSICLSKGLAAPIGSILLGDERLINKAVRWRKMLGGGMRQAGIIAAAAELAITDQVERLAEDHDNAALLAQHLAEMAEFNVDAKQVQTNMVFAELDKRFDVNHLSLLLSQQGILISATYSLRFVTHKDISRQDVLTFVDVLKKCLPQVTVQ